MKLQIKNLDYKLAHEMRLMCQIYDQKISEYLTGLIALSPCQHIQYGGRGEIALNITCPNDWHERYKADCCAVGISMQKSIKNQIFADIESAKLHITGFSSMCEIVEKKNETA
jgi:hypothetical protein